MGELQLLHLIVDMGGRLFVGDTLSSWKCNRIGTKSTVSAARKVLFVLGFAFYRLCELCLPQRALLDEYAQCDQCPKGQR